MKSNLCQAEKVATPVPITYENGVAYQVFEADNGNKYLVDFETGQVFQLLNDMSETGRERPWRDLKVQCITLSEYYLCLSKRSESSVDREYWLNKAARLKSCCNFLIYDVFEDGSKHLKSANSCHVRLCPLCTWRRSVKLMVHVRKIVEAMQTDRGYNYILLTLTVPNVSGDALECTLNKMFKAFHRMFDCSAIKRAVCGWYRGLEITHNVNRFSKSYNTYHPHFHVIIAVSKSYFKSRNYIKQQTWLDLWRHYMSDDSINQVDVRCVKGSNKDGDSVIKAIVEVTKYTVKSSDYILPSNWELSLDTIKVFDSVLNKRRLVAFGGVMKEWHGRLNLDDEIDGNLSVSDGARVGNPISEICYIFNTYYQQYLLYDSGA